jgi:hypothetical protein
MKDKRTATDYIVTRRQARYIAKRNMEEKDITRYNKHSYTSLRDGNGNITSTRNPSYFAENWRDYVRVGEHYGS